jgi:nitronate monooxygenase
MPAWPDRRILDLFGIEHPILQAPMAGASTPAMAIAVGKAGGLGALACALLTVDQVAAALAEIRAGVSAPVNLNYFCHAEPVNDPARDLAWRERLKPYYVEAGLDIEPPIGVSGRSPFDERHCALVEAQRPEVVSFHFGLPELALLDRVKRAGAKVIASATTVAEARWLEAHGCDAVIAMGFEAGGHRGAFLNIDMARQVGTFALVPQVADAVSIPVIAAGAIADARGVVAALALGASAVQIGTAYLLSPEARISALHRAALLADAAEDTAVTNIFTGRPARGVLNRAIRELGPLSADAPAFPLAGTALAPLRAKAEAAGSDDFSQMWSGQAAALARALPAEDFTRALASETLAKLAPKAPAD